MQILNRRFQIDKVLVSAILFTAWVAGRSGASVFAQSWEASEYQIKAAFLYNFAKFVEWPPENNVGAGDPMTICIVGEDPFGNILDEFTKGRTIKDRRVLITRLKPGQDLKGCQIAFISSVARNQLKSIFQNAVRAHVLTVGESEGFSARGGVIGFIREENKVHFEINLDAAQRANLKISSKLLSLAKIVKEQDQGGRINMRAYRDLSIKGKMQAAILFTTGAALLLSSAAFLAYDLVTYRSAMEPTRAELRRGAKSAVPLADRAIGNLKQWLLGTHHGVGRHQLQAYLDEFVFRHNRRKLPMAAFQTLLGLGMGHKSMTYREIQSRRNDPIR